MIRHIVLPSSPGAFRLWLALVVVFHHITRIEVGKAPVLVFFALSGFWVQRVWTTRYLATRRPWLTFIVSRWWRIAPVMVLSVVLSLAVMAVLGDPLLPYVWTMPLRQTFSSVFAVGYADLPVRPLGTAWSLDIEMQFYLVAPLLALVVCRMRAIAVLAAGYGVYLAGLALYPGVVLTSFLPFFLIGMVAAEHRWRPSPRIAEGLLALAIVVTLGMLASPWSYALLGTEGGHWPKINLLLAIMALPQAFVSAQNPTCGRDAVWADQSYIVYMLHWPAIALLRGIAWPDTSARAMGFVGLAAGVALMAWVVRALYDQPLNRARARWVAGRRRQSVAAPGHKCEAIEDGAKGDDRPPVFA